MAALAITNGSAFHFDQDQIALMNTISYGALWPASELPEAISLERG